MSSWQEVDRPDRPDPSLLESAGNTLARLEGEDQRIEWAVGERIDRPRSTLFRLEARLPSGGRVDAYHKTFRSPPYPAERLVRWERTVRSGLSMAQSLESRLADLVAGEEITFSRALAVDVDAMALVTRGVSGSPIPIGLLPGLRKQSRRRLLEAMTLAGHAAHLIEESSPAGIEVDQGALETTIHRRVGRVRAILPEATVDALEDHLTRLNQDLLATVRPLVYCHGDFSGTNIFLTGRGVGLIDFTWSIRQKGFDLAHFAFRLEYDTPAPPSMTAPMIQSLLEGYDDLDAVRQPGYQFVRLSKLLKVVEEGRRSGFGVGGGRARRARSEIEAELSTR